MRSLSRTTLAGAAAAMLLAGCATAPYPRAARYAPAPLPDPEVVAYPAQGQDPRTQRRDRYECHLWAVKESGFDPSGLRRAKLPSQTVAAAPPPSPGPGAAVLGATGAIIGSGVAGHGHKTEGAIAGLVIGALAGAAAENAAAAEVARADAELARYEAPLARDASAYKRAMGACMEGRGYTVR